MARLLINQLSGRVSPALAALVGVLGMSSAAADMPLTHKGYTYQPPPVEEAELHARVPFLQPERDWERIDVYVPKDGMDHPLPCVIVIYGGGYGDKNMPFTDTIPLVRRGYVVAYPDYALQVDSAAALGTWDIGAAIRFLRKHADRFRIDPERIGVWGFSAGGWIVQDLCYSEPNTLLYQGEKWDRLRKGKKTTPGYVPFLQPRPLHPGQSTRVQAAVSDWGAAKLVERKTDNRTKEKSVSPAGRLSPDDPPLMTCFPGQPRPITETSVGFLHALGVPAEPVFMDVKNTHVPAMNTKSKLADGTETTWQEAILGFFNRHLKQVTLSTPPEIRPDYATSGDEVTVELLSVHAKGQIRYTTDGTPPTAASPVYAGPLRLALGTTIKAMATKSGLAPSPVASLKLPDTRPPRITTDTASFAARVDAPFETRFEADGEGIAWFAAGRLGETYRNYAGRSFNPPMRVPWLAIDPKTGVLSGTPRMPGVYPVLITAWAHVERQGRFSHEAVQTDARLVVVTVSE